MAKAILTVLALLLVAGMDATTPRHLDAGLSEPLEGVSAGTLVTITAARTQKKSDSAWGVRWTDTSGTPYSIEMSWPVTDFGTLTHKAELLLTFAKADSILSTTSLTRGVDLNKKPNTLRLHIDNQNRLYWTLGSHTIAATGQEQLDGPPAPGTMAIYTLNTGLDIYESGVVERYTRPAPRLTPLDSPLSFAAPANGADSPAGVWKALDRDNDPQWSRPGGDYTIGVAPSTSHPGQFDIIYLDGATVNAGAWKPGMVKGRLEPTPFARHYNLQWTDAAMEKMGKADECSATLDPYGAILTLSFPLQHATLRFYRFSTQ